MSFSTGYVYSAAWLGNLCELTPDLCEGVRDRFASVDIQNLELEVQIHAGLSIGDILPNELSSDVVWAFGDLRAEHARGVASEEGLLWGFEGVVLGRQVRGVQGGKVTDYSENI